VARSVTWSASSTREETAAVIRVNQRRLSSDRPVRLSHEQVRKPVAVHVRQPQPVDRIPVLSVIGAVADAVNDWSPIRTSVSSTSSPTALLMSTWM
jgi:hypothetical protein